MIEHDKPEEWRPFPRDPRYFVSSHGRISGAQGRILKPSLRTDRHLQFDLGGVKVKVHTAVLETFVGPRPPGYVCRHDDGVPTNNALYNLSWGTRSANHLDRKRHGWVSARHPITSADAADIRKHIAAGRSKKSLARDYGVARSLILAIATGRIHRPYP